MTKLRMFFIVFSIAALPSAIRAQGSGVNNSALNGTYAFSFTGISGSAGGSSSAFAAVGRFVVDGAGNVTNGEVDTNGVGSGSTLVAQAFTGTYSIGADNRGVMNLSIGGGSKLAFAMTADGNAEFIKFDASGGTGIIGSGTMEKVDTAAYATAKITGDYVFGVAGLDNSNNRAALAGRFTSNGTGTLSTAAGDVNAYGAMYQMSFTSATYSVTDTANGRGTMNFAFSISGIPKTLNFAFYIVNAGKLFLMESDVVSNSTPLVSGVVLQQQTPAGGFSNGSLNGNMVIYLTGLSACGSGIGTMPKADAGLLTADGSGSFTLTFDGNDCTTANSITATPGTYTVEANGRATITITSIKTLGSYLAGPNQAILFGTDSNVLFGFGEPQAAGSFTNSDVRGTYAGFTTAPATFGVPVFSGQFAADGATPSGAITGSEDIGAPSGPVSGSALDATYSISSSPANGRGTLSITAGTGSGETEIFYVISPSKFVAVSFADPNPAIMLFQQSAASASVSLTSLVLSPASVTGASQSSAGTVTLSAPAPSGGAQVLLSSDNSAAQVPASVTVPAGSTSATFTVTTSAVSASTSVTISASYAGTTQTAALTVQPARLPTLTSLALSPTSVVGGTQSSTGTVTLSAAAPSNGAQVLLSSNNSAAQVPASVTVPAGGTSANFAVTTNAVTASTAVTISTSYNGITLTAAFTVQPPPLPTLTSLAFRPTSVVGGTQSSTGTITLSAAAPSSGAQVLLSTNNSAAQTPASVTVPAGAISATFNVTTTAVAASRSVALSASYNGSTVTAALTVLAPTLTSLSLSPNSVTGGTQSSTGTVTLNGPAPAGGAQVLLSSNSSAAQVPATVTVPAGATSATFPASTSVVVFSTNATISGSYNGATKQANLAVNSAVPIL